MIDGQPAPEYVIAVASSRVTLLDRDRARELMFSTPRASAAVAERLARRMRRAARQRALLALPSSFQRVCAQLLLLTQPDGSGRIVVQLPPTHQEIAIMVNTSRETVTRTLQFLQTQKVVARAGGALVEPDRVCRRPVPVSRRTGALQHQRCERAPRRPGALYGADRPAGARRWTPALVADPR